MIVLIYFKLISLLWFRWVRYKFANIGSDQQIEVYQYCAAHQNDPACFYVRLPVFLRLISQKHEIGSNHRHNKNEGQKEAKVA